MALDPTPQPGQPELYCATCDRSYPTGTVVCPDDGTRLVQLHSGDPMIGREIDERFVVREKLGEGGMGVVYRAWQASVGREVAIKVIRPRPGADAMTAKRFLREAKLSSQLSNPSTVTVIDFGQAEDGTLYLVMELLRGRTMADEIRGSGRLAPARVVRIGAQICDALEAAHHLGIVHRDLKPSNVMILSHPPGRDHIKVLDFGLAKAVGRDESTVTQSGRMVGTPSHLPPEVALGSEATARSDLYAVGVMLYEMLDGRPPFAADNVQMMVALHAYQPPPPLGPHVPSSLAQVVNRVLAKNPELRPASAVELRHELEEALKNASNPVLEQTADPSPSPLPLLRRAHERSDLAMAETLRKGKGTTRPPIDPSDVVAAPAPGASAAVTLRTRPPRRRWPLAVLVAGAIGGGAAVVVALARRGDERPAPTEPATGAMSDDVIKAHVDRGQLAALGCAARHDAYGDFLLHLEVNPSGAVDWVTIEGDLDGPARECLRSVYVGLRFPATGGMTRVKMPLVLEAGAATAAIDAGTAPVDAAAPAVDAGTTTRRDRDRRRDAGPRATPAAVDAGVSAPPPRQVDAGPGFIR